MVPCLFQLNFVFWHIFFSILTSSFSFFTSRKRIQNYFTTIEHILDVLFIPFIYSYCYLHFVKSVQIRGFFCPYFLVFGLNTGKYGPEEIPFRSRHQKCSVKEGVLENFAKFCKKKTCARALF